MKLDGTFVGRVVYNDDPTHSGRCKIKVFGIFDDTDDDDIPWFNPSYGNAFSGNGSGMISIPKIGSIMKVRFLNEDLYSGEYVAIQNMDPMLIKEIESDYQNTHVLLYDSEKDLIIFYQPMTGIKISLAGSFVKVDSDGTVQLKHRNDSNVIELRNNSINITTVSDGGTQTNGTINISSGSAVNITSPVVNVNSNHVNLGGENAGSRAVYGEKLISVLQQIVMELNTKFPQGTSTLVGKTFEEILSPVVKMK